MIKTFKGHFKNFHPFGCPLYVLDENLQSGKKLPTWNPRYVLKTRIDHISPQYHIIHNDDFATVSVQTELQEVNIWKGINKTQLKLGLVNQLPNQENFDFKV